MRVIINFLLMAEFIEKPVIEKRLKIFIGTLKSFFSLFHLKFQAKLILFNLFIFIKKRKHLNLLKQETVNNPPYCLFSS